MSKDQLPRMLQALLAERFHLSVHRESKEQSVYALIQGKSGPKLHEAANEPGKPGLRQRDDSFTFTSAGMSNLVAVLSQVTGRKVLDKTGLRGTYDFTLSYAPDSGGANGVPDSVFTAVREQLGLDLEAQKAPVAFVIVDRLDRLIPN
jgi:uncharacterized protein (TIGR03435 family)